MEMDARVEENVQYYEFLNFVQEMAKKTKSLQSNSIKVVFQNFDVCIFKNRIEKQIAKLDKMLSE
ncbi:hypothetical protein AC481_00290 [miscellaneous Crenarchaeota group archaeon SMTZ-80]|nr:MAG: hypothetical protein AC481_00290 [miscellaneous Crenarchaeota group archaeon SMTZ-80]